MSSFCNNATPSDYTGRFAPSPSGPLHFGSLVAALASYFDAKHYHGQWLVRMEDIDPPREESGAQAAILNALVAHGLEWDGSVLYQSQRLEAYKEVLAGLEAYTYRCECGRQRLSALGGVYDGYCRQRQGALSQTTSLRLNLNGLSKAHYAQAENYRDLFQGERSQSLQREVGDFILRRKDGLFAYQLAVVVDDMAQGVTHVIRGSDLLSSTFRQRYLILLLQGSLPSYGHIPVVTNPCGEKLSKQRKAPPIDNRRAFDNVCRGLHFLHHQPPIDVATCGDIRALIQWGIVNWRRSNIPQEMSFMVEDMASRQDNSR